MIFEKPSLLHHFGEKYETTNITRTKSLTSFRARDPTVPILSDNTGSNLSPHETSRRLQLIVDCARKVLVADQVAIVVLVPYIVHWVTQTTEEELGNGASDVTKIAEALETKLGGPNSELVAEHVVRASTRAQLGIQNRNTIELRASEKLYKVDLDCYFDDPDLHATVALVTPLNDTHKTGYEGAQLSSMRYHLGMLITRLSLDENHHGHNLSDIRRNNKIHTLPSKKSMENFGSTIASPSNQPDSVASSEDDFELRHNNNDSDFLPTMTGKEVEHFYAMLPGTSANSYTAHETHVAMDRSINEEELLVGDPDNFDPHLRMRLIQQSSLSPVLPRRPREPAVVQAELELEARMFGRGNLGPRQGTSAQKKNDVRCLQCGVDSSPEWRKGPMGPKTLCNRCGLRYAKKLRMGN